MSVRKNALPRRASSYPKHATPTPTKHPQQSPVSATQRCDGRPKRNQAPLEASCADRNHEDSHRGRFQ